MRTSPMLVAVYCLLSIPHAFGFAPSSPSAKLSRPEGLVALASSTAVEDELDTFVKVEFPPPLTKVERLQRAAQFWSSALPIVLVCYQGMVTKLVCGFLLSTHSRASPITQKMQNYALKKHLQDRLSPKKSRRCCGASNTPRALESWLTQSQVSKGSMSKLRRLLQVDKTCFLQVRLLDTRVSSSLYSESLKLWVVLISNRLKSTRRH